MPSRSADAAAGRILLIEAVVAARARQKRHATLALAFGLALFVGGAIVTIASHGQLIWFGGVVAGALMAVRAVMTLLGLSTRED